MELLMPSCKYDAKYNICYMQYHMVSPQGNRCGTGDGVGDGIRSGYLSEQGLVEDILIPEWANQRVMFVGGGACIY